MQQCPYPAWSPDYPGSEQPPYNAPANPCIDHMPSATSLTSVPAQLVVSLDITTPGPPIRGAFGIAGNIPPLAGAMARPVEVCTDFAGDAQFEAFKQLLYRNTW